MSDLPITIQKKIEHLEQLRVDVSNLLKQVRIMYEKIKGARREAQLEEMVAARDAKIRKLTAENHELHNSNQKLRNERQKLEAAISDREDRRARHEQHRANTAAKKREQEMLKGRLYKRPSLMQWMHVWNNWDAATLRQKLPYLQHTEGDKVNVCEQCKGEYDVEEIRRQYGDVWWTFKYCSARCHAIALTGESDG